MAADKRSRPPLALTPPTAAPVQDRGKLMIPKEVSAEIFNGIVSWRWVLENAPARYRVLLGRKVCFRERDMIEWRESITGEGAPR